MTSLTWRTARELRLTDKLIPNPNSTSELLDRLDNIRVALSAGWLHIDPRDAGNADRNPGDPEFDVFTVPASAVARIVFRETKERQPEVHSA